MMPRARAAHLVALLSAFVLVSACSDEKIGTDEVVRAPGLPGVELEPDASVDMREAPCIPAVTSEALPARAATMGDDKLGTNEGVHVSQLFNQFKTNCGDCHVTPASLGQFSLTLGDFLNAQDEFLAGKINKTIQLIRSSDPDKVMPKNGPLLKDRPADHPLRTFADLLEQWLREGRPVTFFPKGSGAGAVGGGSGSPFRLKKEVGTKLTNIGNCVPAGRGQALKMEGADMEDAKALDEKFAAMRTFGDLPKSLRETDLTTLDSGELMKRQIFGYAPTYTLWADNAKKIRMVRVPVGESIRFDKDTQSFDIPENTRFYKTFLRQVKDLEGRVGYRKIETRIILARKATTDADGKTVQNAIFGTYQWNDDETEATLVDTPYRDDEGFQDRILQVVLDEQLDDKVLRTKPKDPLAARLAAGSMRSYAIPGFDRCVQCHMGAPKQDFVLGFTPLQVWRRPQGEGGVYEPAGRDELNQLQRLINYGLITGIRTADEIVPLEESQGDRKPRNEHELTAQGYMMGNCAHCHNPNGFPSLKEAVMKEDLNFWPSEEGGIFQFPLERYSRRTYRGAAQNIRIPYITPSLYDFTPPQLEKGILEIETTENGKSLISSPSKWITRTALSTESVEQRIAWEWQADSSKPRDVEIDLGGGATKRIPLSTWVAPAGSARPLYAPWRSLVYRNVDSPFSYQEAGTVFPHMPMNTPGYDCRSRVLLGKWMVSIPSRWKMQGRPSRYRWLSSTVANLYESQPLTAGKLFDEGLQDPNEQPYEEVKPDEDGFLSAELDAQARLSHFVGSERFKDCPDPALDILDPVTAATGNSLPASAKVELRETNEVYEVLAPARPHYFQTDLRLSKRWVLRRGDWYQSLVEGNDAYSKGQQKTEAFNLLRETLQGIKVDDAWRAFATEQVPFGLWKQSDANQGVCEAEFDKRSIPRVSQYSQSSRPSWMQNAPATDAKSSQYRPDARIFMTSPGEHVFDLVCAKCHGSKGDGDSALASTMADLTGGLTRVANLRDGIFGPLMSPGSNRAIPKLGFGVIGNPSERENWAARYVAWMGLGGTRAYIPEAVVGSLRRFTILGELSALQTSFEAFEKADAGNMLKVAKDFCTIFFDGGSESEQAALDAATGRLSKDPGDPNRPGFLFSGSNPEPFDAFSIVRHGLIVSNGHAELWERLCTYQNPLPVRVVRYVAAGTRGAFLQAAMYRRDAYPADALVGTGDGKNAPLADDNLWPWCVVRPVQDSLIRALEGKEVPYCPEQVSNPDDDGRISSSGGLGERDRWTLRGAANAGVAVFLFMDHLNKALAQGKVPPRNVAYDRCQDFAAVK